MVLVPQIRKIKGLTDNFYFASPESYKLIGLWVEVLLFIPYTAIVFYLILLIALFWDIYLGLLAAITPKRSKIKEIHPIQTRLGSIVHSGDLYYGEYSSTHNK